MCGSDTHKVPKNTDKKDGTQHKGIQKNCSHEEPLGVSDKFEDKNTTVHMPLDPSLHSQHFVTRPATAPKPKLCNKAKQAPKRYRATSSSHELMKCTHLSCSKRWKQEEKGKLITQREAPAAMTMTMTTLLKDGTDMCLASGPAGMSDGGRHPSKSVGNLDWC